MDWKTERAKLLEKVDSGLQEYVADPAERAGIGPFGAGLSAGISAAADFFTPEDATDAALMAVGGPLLGKLGKIGQAKKLNKVLGRAKGGITKTEKAADKLKYAEEVVDYADTDWTKGMAKEVFNPTTNKWEKAKKAWEKTK